MEFVVAQDNVGDESTISYPASYFSQWSPVTAQDMLIRIPGFDAQSIGGSSRSSRSRGASSGRSRGGSSGGSAGRGFGGGSRTTEVLINGKMVGWSPGGPKRRVLGDKMRLGFYFHSLFKMIRFRIVF